MTSSPSFRASRAERLYVRAAPYRRRARTRRPPAHRGAHCMSTNQPRVVITGLGATTPLGGDVESTWAALLAGKSGVRPLPWDNVDELPLKFAAQLAVPPEEILPKHKL